MTDDALLLVDREPVPLNPFVGNVIRGTLQGILSSLKDVPSDPVEIVADWTGPDQVSLQVNGATVRLNDFVRRFTGHVLAAMTASLDGVPASPRTIQLTLRK